MPQCACSVKLNIYPLVWWEGLLHQFHFRLNIAYELKSTISVKNLREGNICITSSLLQIFYQRRSDCTLCHATRNVQTEGKLTVHSSTSYVSTNYLHPIRRLLVTCTIICICVSFAGVDTTAYIYMYHRGCPHIP